MKGEDLQALIGEEARAQGLIVAFAPLGQIPVQNLARPFWSPSDLPALEDPRVLSPWARSIACFALPYPSGGEQLEVASIAPFCAFDWYGQLKKKLSRIKTVILARFPNLRVKVVVEGKLLEKTWAQRAGIGNRGKNSLIYHPLFGSRILLGELLLSAELEEESPGKTESPCGECSLCLEACPVKAIPSPYHVRAERCLDFFTLHFEGTLPLEIRHTMGTALFGCSICQDVCPLNVREEAPPYFNPSEFPSGPGRSISYEEALEMEETEFGFHFSGHAFAKIPWTIFKRNALIVCGNSLRTDLLNKIVSFTNYPLPLFRRHAVWSLWRIDAEKAAPILRGLKLRESDPGVIEEIEQLLAEGLQSEYNSKNIDE